MRTAPGQIVSVAEIPARLADKKSSSAGCKSFPSSGLRRKRCVVSDTDIREQHDKHDGNIYRIAKHLGISWPAAQKRVKKLGLS